MDRLLARLERYYDAVPRRSARAEDHGPLTLFCRDGPGWPFYARPRLGGDTPIGVADVTAVRARQRALGMPETFEWVDEVTPSLRDAARKAGLLVHRHPLMVLDLASWRPAESPPGAALRVCAADDEDLPRVLAVSHVAFGNPGTAAGPAGRMELEFAARQEDPARVEDIRKRITRGYTVIVAAEDRTGLLASGWHQPVDDVTEIVGVGTLPFARRRGLAAAVTSLLVAQARERGTDLIFLSADDDAVARIYARLGFRRAATAMIAEPKL